MSKRIGLRYLQAQAGAKLCTVQIVVYQDGVPVYTSKVQIGTTLYQNGQSPTLFLRTYSLAFVPGDTAYFYKWAAAGNISVGNAYASSTTLTVSCGGTLTLNLTSLPAPNYDDLVGTIWMPEPQGYDDTGGNRIELRDPYGASPAGDSNGGSYDNRQ